MPPARPLRPHLPLLLLLLLLARQPQAPSAQVLDFLLEKWKLYGDQCLHNLSLLPPPTELVCNRTFDKYSCWPDTPPNTTASIACPWYLPWHHKGAAVERRLPVPAGRGRGQGREGGGRDVQHLPGDVHRGVLPLAGGAAAGPGGPAGPQEAALHAELHPREPVRVLRAQGRLRAGHRRAAQDPLQPEDRRRPQRERLAERWVRSRRQLLLAAGGGRVPAQPAGPRCLPREEPLRPLPGHRLGCPRAVCHPLGGGQVSVRERPVLDQQQQYGLLVDPALPRLPGHFDQFLHFHPHPSHPRGQAACPPDAPHGLQIPAGQVHADPHPPAGGPRSGVCLRDGRARPGHTALRQALLRPPSQLLPGSAGGRPVLLPQQGGAGGAAAELAPLARRQGPSGGAPGRQPPGLGPAGQWSCHREAAALRGPGQQRGQPGRLCGGPHGRQHPWVG
ncbi:glucagon receptor isoform X4 [Pteronotus mesoamericanus]|uniref:glucagon receptor isoform X4 n=1 Tax=Pteronotus mesoamericanus TaxID=1884717 RepID=UPI0023EBA77E|nr:glucagon receptor isoform X4 [Pteronotus parnellii mesoamericanus]